MSSTSSLAARQPADGLADSVALVVVSAVTEYETASPPSVQLRPVATLVVLRLVVPEAIDTAPSAPLPMVRFEAQVAPANPVAQAQVNAFTPSVQVPPLRHGLGEQSSMFTHPVDPVPL